MDGFNNHEFERLICNSENRNFKDIQQYMPSGMKNNIIKEAGVRVVSHFNLGVNYSLATHFMHFIVTYYVG